LTYNTLPYGKITDPTASASGLSRLILTGWSSIVAEVIPDPDPTPAATTYKFSFGIPRSEEDGLSGGIDDLSGFLAPAHRLKKVGSLRVDARFKGSGRGW